jgi:hypothetical protein
VNKREHPARGSSSIEAFIMSLTVLIALGLWINNVENRVRTLEHPPTTTTTAMPGCYTPTGHRYEAESCGR